MTDAMVLPAEVLALLRHAGTRKVVATTGPDGAPHVAVRDALEVLADGTLAFPEELDSSRTSRDLVHAIWFQRPVAVGIDRGDDRWVVRGTAERCLIVGPLFRRFLVAARQREGPDADIAAVWVIRPEVAWDETPAAARARDHERRPYAGAHLDRASIRREAGEDLDAGPAPGRQRRVGGEDVADSIADLDQASEASRR